MTVSTTTVDYPALTQLTKQIEDRAQAKANERLRQVLVEVATKVGLKAEDLAGTAPAKQVKANGTRRARKARGSGGRKNKLPPMYRNPADSTQTWTGRGRAPTWLTALERKPGRNREDYRIAAAG